LLTLISVNSINPVFASAEKPTAFEDAFRSMHWNCRTIYNTNQVTVFWPKI